MNNIIKPVIIAFFCFFSCTLFAVNNPKDIEGSRQFDAMRCVSENTQVCINSICLNSDQRDCQSNCNKTAQEKCQQQRNE